MYSPKMAGYNLSAMKLRIILVALLFTASALAQHERQFVFTRSNGANPFGGVIFDIKGNLYGSTGAGGTAGLGVVYEISPAGGNQATETVLYNFTGTNGDGANPRGDLIFDSLGNLYGTTYAGGAFDLGTVFELSPPSSPGGEWTESVLHSFQGMPSDGTAPTAGLVFDALGNLYGTTSLGGFNSGFCDGGCGVVFELTPASAPDGTWTESVLYFFQGSPDGCVPLGGVVFDPLGNLYGTTSGCGPYENVHGTIFELSPPSQPGGTWTEAIIHSFVFSNGTNPPDGLARAANGTLFGVTDKGGQNGYGTIFMLEPSANSGGSWSFGIVHSFSGGYPMAGVTVGNSNTLYGTSNSEDGGYAYSVSTLHGSVTFTELYNFGLHSFPSARPTLNKGAIYGTTLNAGHDNQGTVFQLLP